MPAFTWRAGLFINETQKQLEQGLTKAGLYLTSKLRRDVNRSQKYKRYTGSKGVYIVGQNPSKPGEHPKKLTGQLQRSITWEVKKGKLVLVVGSALDYAGYLQKGTRYMKPRPFLTLTLRREKEKIKNIIVTRGR